MSPRVQSPISAAATSGAPCARGRPGVAASRFGPPLLLWVLLAATSGCLSVQGLNADGAPYVLGVGSSSPADGAEGAVYRVRAPGLSVRAIPGIAGLSLGWHETTYFVPRPHPSAPRSFIAVQLEGYGIDVGPFFVALGYHRLFGVFVPPETASRLQSVVNSDAQGVRAWVHDVESAKGAR